MNWLAPLGMTYCVPSLRRTLLAISIETALKSWRAMA